MIPIDLEKEFGRRWRIELDESAVGRRGDPWMFLIPCRHGHLYAAGPDLIGAATDHAGAIVRKLREIPGVTVVADGTDGCNAVFSSCPSPRPSCEKVPLSERDWGSCRPDWREFGN